MNVAIIALAVAATGTPAQDGRGTSDDAVTAIVACRQVDDEGRRLACFDAAVGTLAQARDRRDIVVLDRKEVQATRRSLFGFSLPKIRLFGNGDDEASELRQLDGTVAGVSPAPSSRWTITLADGTRWLTTEGDEGYPPRAGETVVIRKAALGSYAASFNKRRSLKVRRVE